MEGLTLACDALLKSVAGKTVEGSTPSPSARLLTTKTAPEGWESDPDYVYIGRAPNGATAG